MLASSWGTSSGSCSIDICFKERLRLHLECRNYLLSKSPFKFYCRCIGSFTAVSAIFSSMAFFLTGVLVIYPSLGSPVCLIFRLMVLRRSCRPLMKLGWLKMLFEWSLRDLWNPYMLSWRTKLFIFPWRKNWGRTTCSNLLTSLIIKSLPEGPQ